MFCWEPVQLSCLTKTSKYFALQSLGETLEEGKKQKVKKPKEQRKDKKKRSVEKTSSSEEYKEELDQEEEETKSDQTRTTETDSTMNVVASNLQNFSKNFNLVYSGEITDIFFSSLIVVAALDRATFLTDWFSC